jgi:anti-sigma factor RsiW
VRQPDHVTDIELLRLADGELGNGEAARIAAHVEACDACRARRETLTARIAETIAALRTAGAIDDAERARSRAALEARLAAATAHADRPWTIRARLFSSSVGRWSTAAAAIAAVFLTARALRSRPEPPASRAGVAIERDALPIAAFTPGATSDVSADELCRSGEWEPEPADPAVRQRILANYGMAHVPEEEYELDYLITPALGGANDPRNLWPERYSDRTWNAKVKDQLEELLPSLVCAGRIDLHTAQRDIAADWIAAYKKYFKTDVPLKAGT